MKVELLHKSINKISPISDLSWEALKAILKEVIIKNKEYIIAEGEYAREFFFLSEGIVRVHINKDGKEYTQSFYTEGSFPTPFSALISGVPSYSSFHALKELHLISFPYRKFLRLFRTHSDLERFYFKLVEKEFVKKELQNFRLLTKDTIENYTNFRTEFPGLEQEIAQYHIAAYLGITPSQLSRVRSKVSK